MLATLYTKAVRDRWLSIAVGVLTLGLLLLLGLAAYQQIDLAIYNDLPEAFRAVIGIPEGADATALAFTAIYGSYGALTLGGLAISLGSGAIAGEERDGTLGLLLSNPRSRTAVLLSKAGALFTLTTIGALVLLAAGYGSAAVLGVELGGAGVDALLLHLWLNSLFHGAVALAVGAWTGRRTLASSAAAGVLVAGFIATGLLPFTERLADGVRLFPWHYFAGSEPFVNGVDAGHAAVLAVGAGVLLLVAWIGVNRRDLRSGNGDTSLIDRLREDPRTQRIVERLAGQARVSRLWIKTASDHQGLALIVAAVMFGTMGVMIGVMYSAIEGALQALTQLPDVFLALAGGGGTDPASPEGWYQLETFGLMAPASVMVLTVAVGARGLAGEERNRTMSLLLAAPVPRRRVVLETFASMALHAAAIGLAIFAGVVTGSVLGGLGMDVVGIAAASALATLLGLVFGALALALGAATGRARVAIWGAIGIALVALVANNLLPLAERLAGYARLSPFHYYLSSDPLNNGMHWGHAAVLVAVLAVLVVAAVALFERRDIRQG